MEINLSEKYHVIPNLKRWSVIRNYLCKSKLTESDFKDMKSLRFSDISDYKYGHMKILDFEVNRTYDVVEDWTTLDDDGYMSVFVLKDRWKGENLITEDRILGRIYSSVLISHFEWLPPDVVRDGLIDQILL